MYADDCALIISENDAQSLEVKINDVLKSMDKWFCANNLKMNLNKLSFMLIKKSYLTKQVWSVNIDDKLKEIKQVRCQKFLGITIDEHLDWNTHTDKLCSSLKSSSYLFKNLVEYCDIETLKTVYHSYFKSKIKYGILSWGVTKKQNITSILKCQKRILRIQRSNTTRSSLQTRANKILFRACVE